MKAFLSLLCQTNVLSTTITSMIQDTLSGKTTTCNIDFYSVCFAAFSFFNLQDNISSFLLTFMNYIRVAVSNVSFLEKNILFFFFSHLFCKKHFFYKWNENKKKTLMYWYDWLIFLLHHHLFFECSHPSQILYCNLSIKFPNFRTLFLFYFKGRIVRFYIKNNW